MHATVLFAHGSRDPAWRVPMDKVADKMRALHPDILVRCAFLELMTPDLQAVTAELATLPVQSITIVPMFLGIGKHAREDLPKLVMELKEIYPNILFLLRPSIGEDERVIDLLANLSVPANLANTKPKSTHCP